MSDAFAQQTQMLVEKLDHWFALFDEQFGLDDVPLHDRPFRSVLELLRVGGLKVRYGDDFLDVSQPWDHVAEPWFRGLFVAAEQWYREQFGERALEAGGNPPLRGVTLIRRTPFRVLIPMHRGEVEEEGRLAWMYFEAGIGEGEDPSRWLQNGPDLSRIPDDRRAEDFARLTAVCEGLRGINHQLLGAGTDGVSRGFRQAIRGYLESAADRIVAGGSEDLAFAWFDLQMAMESALKLARQSVLGDYLRSHDLVDMLGELVPHGVTFAPANLRDWPQFPEMSNLRYAQAAAGGTAAVFDAYLLGLGLIRAALGVLTPPVPSGAGILLKPAPWLVDDPDRRLLVPTSKASFDGDA